MADCAPPFARPALRNTFSRCFLFLFALSAAVAAPAAVYDSAPGCPGLPRAIVAGGRFTFGG